MTRVVHVILSVDDAAGGPATLLADVLPLADRLGHESVVLAVQTAPSRVADAMRRHARVVTTGRGRFLGRAHTHARMFLDIWREARAADVLVAHSFFNLPGVVTALVAGVRRRPLVIAPHGCLDPYDVRKHRRAKAALAPLWRLVLQRATVWCITDREARELVTFGARPHCVVVAPPVVVPGPTVEATAHALLERAVPEALAAARRGGVVVSFVGRFAEKKGLPRLLDAFESVARDDDVLVLAGASDAAYDGLRFDLDRTLAANRRRAQVARPGWIDAETRSALWTLPSVFVLPSDDENFGMAVAEAMAGGVPVVVSDRVALADLVADTDSGVVTSTDPAEVGAALRALLADPERRQATGRRARRAVEDHFSPDAVTRAYAGLVHTAVTR